MATTQERVTNIIVELLGVDADKVTPEARFREDLEADSSTSSSSSWPSKTNSVAKSRTKSPGNHDVGDAISYIDNEMNK